MFLKSEKINVLNQIKQNSLNNLSKTIFILFELLDDEMVKLDCNSKPYLTFYGLKEINNWEPVLGVSVNDQLVVAPYGEA